MMRDSPPLIEPYVIVAHHTAPLFFISYVISLLFFIENICALKTLVRLAGKCSQRITRQQGRNIYIYILLRPFLYFFSFMSF